MQLLQPGEVWASSLINRASNVSPKAHLRVNEDLCYIEGHLRRHKACRLALTSLEDDHLYPSATKSLFL